MNRLKVWAVALAIPLVAMAAAGSLLANVDWPKWVEQPLFAVVFIAAVATGFVAANRVDGARSGEDRGVSPVVVVLVIVAVLLLSLLDDWPADRSTWLGLVSLGYLLGVMQRGWLESSTTAGMAAGLDRITIDHESGSAPRIRDLDITVGTVVARMADGWSAEEIVAEYAGLEPEDVHECLVFAARTAGRRSAVSLRRPSTTRRPAIGSRR